MKIVLDCFGGDRSPDANVEGALLALEEYPDLTLILSGDEAVLREKLAGRTYDKDRIEFLHAPEVIDVNEKPTDVIRIKKESSMMKAVRLLIDDPEVSGMVTIGSTGAIVAAGMLKVGRLKNVIRPAFCPVFPTMAGTLVGVCDSGANVDVTPQQLLQNAVMASLYMQTVYDVKEPRVALLNIGVEEEKGDALRKEAYQLLKACDQIRFEGNMESRDLLSGRYDVIVCDGFAGNVLVKTAEGVALELLSRIRKDIFSRLKYKIGALFLKQMFAEEKAFLDYQNYGGSVLLGAKKTVIKGHGSSKAVAVQKCIGQAYRMELGKLNENLEKAFS